METRIDRDELDYRAIVQHLPGLFLILDAGLTIVGVSDAYTRATLTRREEMVGKHLFEVFPDNPDDSSADGVHNKYQGTGLVPGHHEAHCATAGRGYRRHQYAGPGREA